MNNLEIFVAAYAVALDKKFAQTPDAFANAVKAAHATQARQRTLDLDADTVAMGPDFEAACRAVGIRPSYKAIRAYFAADQIPGVTVPRVP